MAQTDAMKLSAEDMAKHIPGPSGERFHIGLLRGQLQVELYCPQNEDFQKPHDRDECYVIIQGEGQFEMDNKMVHFQAGDFLFVPAGMPHRFVDFGKELSAWVIFYGPIGGEMPRSQIS